MTEVKGFIKPFDTIGQSVRNAADAMTGYPLSGYLAGKERGGRYVRALEEAWCSTFHVKHAIAVNSATSGLLAAAFAVDLSVGDEFICSPLTMSATAAAPMFTGARPLFIDVEDETFSIDDSYLGLIAPNVRAMFVTNLFGHPARLHELVNFCDRNRMVLIEDNAQSPFAREGKQYAGTIGHIGVWSLNIHKPIQCGEGGVITTDDDELADRMRNFINHGENVSNRIGLNLRMPEISAAIALTQLQRGPEIVAGRVAQAQEILTEIGYIPGIWPPVVREGCSHVYYTIPFLIDRDRLHFCDALRAEGVPIVEGYVEPLYRKPAFAEYAKKCPVAEELHRERLFYFENCAWDPTPEQIKQIGSAFRKAAERAL